MSELKKAPPVEKVGGDVMTTGGSTTDGDNGVTYTSGDVSRFNYHAVEAITVAQDVYVSLDGTNFIATPVYLDDMNQASKDVVFNAIPAGEFGVIRGKFKAIKVLQAGAGAASSCRVLHGVE